MKSASHARFAALPFALAAAFPAASNAQTSESTSLEAVTVTDEPGFTGQNSVKQLYNGLEISNAGGVVSFPFDPWNFERIEALSSTGPLGNGFSYRFDLSHRRSDNWVDRGESESLAVAGALRFDASDRLNFTCARTTASRTRCSTWARRCSTARPCLAR